MLVVNLIVFAVIGLVGSWRVLAVLRWGTRSQRAVAAGAAAAMFDTLFYVAGLWPHSQAWVLGAIWAGPAILVAAGLAVAR